MMVYCQAYGCTNRPGTDKDTKRHYFKFPNTSKEKLRFERWLQNIGTGFIPKTFKLNNNKRVCSDHFHEKCIFEDPVAKMLNYEPKHTKLNPESGFPQFSSTRCTVLSI